ncbi:MAG: TetR/AcrR family transcriptional regulator [Actinomycetes bacterium]
MAEAASDDRREQMLRAAIDVIAERGFPETRISDIGRRVGASSALVIYYFGTKDRLLTDALRYSEDLFYAEAARRLDAIEGARDKIEALVQMSCSSGGTDGLPGSWLLWPDLWAQAVRHPEVSKDREELDQRWREKVAGIVRAGVASGEFAAVDVDDFTLVLTGLLDGLAVQVALGDPTVSSERATEVTMRLVARELGFEWVPAQVAPGGTSRRSAPRVRSAAAATRRPAGGR